MTSTEDRLVLGTGSHVIALEKATGTIAWKTKLPFAASDVSVHVEGGFVYAGGLGEVACLDAATGTLRWHNALKGLGMGDIRFAAASARDVASAIVSLGA